MSKKNDYAKRMMSTLSGQPAVQTVDRFAAAALVGEAATSPSLPPTEATTATRSYPVASVHDSPMNARHIYDPEQIAQLATSLAANGQLSPAHAYVHPTLPGHYVLIDGHMRKKALLSLKRTEIDLIILPRQSDLDTYRMSYALNVERNPQTALDNALAWRSLLSSGAVKGEAEISEILGLSPASVNKTLSLLNLPAPVLEKIKESPGSVGTKTGYTLTLIAQHVPPEELITLVNRIISENLSSRDVEAILASIRKKPQRKKKETSRQYKLMHGERCLGVVKETDRGRVVCDVVIVDEAERQTFIEELKKRFTKVDSGKERES